MPRLIRALALAAATLALVPSAHAAGGNGASTDPATVPGGDYKVEPNHTRTQFSVDHMGFTDWYGDFTGVSGTLHLDPKDPAAARFDIAIPVASVATTNATLDGELKSADWFDAAQFPTIRFASSKVVRTSPNTAQVTGALTFHGVTRQVMLTTRFHGAGVNPMSKAYTVGFDATGMIRRSDFGVTKYVPLVGDMVNLRISAAFEKAS